MSKHCLGEGVAVGRGSEERGSASPRREKPLPEAGRLRRPSWQRSKGVKILSQLPVA